MKLKISNDTIALWACGCTAGTAAGSRPADL